jgi:hypothetical protein
MSLGWAEVIRWIKFGNGGPAVEPYRGVITVPIVISGIQAASFERVIQL